MIWTIQASGVTAICATQEETWKLCLEWLAMGLAPVVTVAILS